MRALRLAPALLAALAACTVETKSLKPKTDAECVAKDPATKACGYKCVRADDPATGCGVPGVCSPCALPAVPNTVPACDTSLAQPTCTILCKEGFSDCNATGIVAGTDGCEVNVNGNDAFHCGSCGRVCPGSGACDAGACSGVAITTVSPVRPQDIQQIGGRLYFVDPDLVNASPTSPGAIWDVDGGVTVVVGTGRDATWLSGWGSGGAIFSGTYLDLANPPLNFDLAIGFVTSIAQGSFIPGPVAYPSSATDLIAGLAAIGTDVYFTAAEQNVVYHYDDGTGTVETLQASPVQPRGIAVDPVSGYGWFGSAANGGEIYKFHRSTSATSILASGTGHPSRLAVFDNPTYFPQLLFWISEDDGSVRAMRTDGGGAIATLVPPQAHAVYYPSITADEHGVYWSNWWTGRLQMWDAATDRVLELGTSFAPFAVAVRYPWVYWTDDLGGALYRVTVP